MATSDPGERYQTWRQLKDAVGIPQLLGSLGLDLPFKRQRSHWVGPCPVHLGDNPGAFRIDCERDLWYCHTRCREGGDVISLAYRLCGRSWSRTASCLRAISEGSHSRPASPATTPSMPRRARSRPFRPFTRHLPLDPLHPFFKDRGLCPDTLRFFEAGAWRGRGFLEGMVAVRLHDTDGQPLGYAGRRLDPEDIARHRKWKMPPGFPKRRLLFSWHRARPHLDRGLILVEGPWDVMKLHQAGYPNTVALNGSAISQAQRIFLRQAPRLVLLLDGDPTGRHASHQMVRDRIHHRLEVIHCPRGADPAQLTALEIRTLLRSDPP